MILLLGGTADTSPIALGLARRGYRVLVSRATEVPLHVGDHPAIETRCGSLDENALAELIVRRGVRAIVDAAHPYAVAIHTTARRIAGEKNIPYLSFVRLPSVGDAAADIEFAPDHAAAAVAAFARGLPVLLTTGTRNLVPYVEQARRTGLPLVVRALDHPDSLRACLQAGVPRERILAGRGPFSTEENRQTLRAFGIGVLVTKDSGASGGTAEKIEAARAEGCHVVVVARPELGTEDAYANVDSLLAALADALR